MSAEGVPSKGVPLLQEIILSKIIPEQALILAKDLIYRPKPGRTKCNNEYLDEKMRKYNEYCRTRKSKKMKNAIVDYSSQKLPTSGFNRWPPLPERDFSAESTPTGRKCPDGSSKHAF